LGGRELAEGGDKILLKFLAKISGFKIFTKTATKPQLKCSFLQLSLNVFFRFTCSQLGQVEMVSSLDEHADEGHMREQLITKHYEGRIADTTLLLQLADSKALHYYAEVRDTSYSFIHSLFVDSLWFCAFIL